MNTMDALTDDELDLLPTGWLTEGVQEASCQKVEDGHRVFLRAAPGVRYFGVRLAGTKTAVALSVGRISFNYGLVSCRDVVALHLVMREWRHAGPFNFQTQKLLPLTSDNSAVDLCLSVRESGMALEPVLLCEAAEINVSAEATVFIGGNLHFTVT